MGLLNPGFLAVLDATGVAELAKVVGIETRLFKAIKPLTTYQSASLINDQRTATIGANSTTKRIRTHPNQDVNN